MHPCIPLPEPPTAVRTRSVELNGPAVPPNFETTALGVCMYLCFHVRSAVACARPCTSTDDETDGDGNGLRGAMGLRHHRRRAWQPHHK